MNNSHKFISLFKKLEKLAADQSQLPRETNFSKMLAKITGGNNVFSYYKEDLQQFAKLRNAIVHESVSDDKAIAEPHDEVVSKLELIVEKIENPPKVIPQFQVDIETIDLGAQISDALDIMYEDNFSQLPVLENDKFHDLLTTDTVARWISANKDEDGYLLENVAVREVLPYKEFQENYRFISRSTTLIEVLRIFREVDYKVQPLDALLITNDGKKEQKLLGIITHYDVSNIVSMI
jgi:predicted transcriptional regulator